ncbi:MAG: DNA cytosine methyltransferase [Symploca sp. SIO1B1]|nr:DNA cytosine methyltransferase [Symploca sp. SIO1C2]NER99207.1 DNA cytosine methyltransferase [Symploca sp. SIO1B1]
MVPSIKIPNLTPNQRPLAIDLFAGVGGFSLGIEQAGFDIAVAVEQDPIHAAVYGFNFPHTRVLCKDIAQLSTQEIQEAVGQWATDNGRPSNNQIDLVIGGPPCQGFSNIGKRQLDDARNQLVFEFCRLVKELQPRYFIMENVSGLYQKKYQTLFEQLLNKFQAAGYTITEPVQLLNAASFGVPQKRRRLFILGTQVGIGKLAYPEPKLTQKSQYLTVRDAIADLPNLDDFTELQKNDTVQLTPQQVSLLKARAMPYVEKLRDDIITEKDNFAYPRDWNPELLTSSMQTQHNQTSIERFENTLPGTVEPISRLRRLNWEQPCHTLRAGTGKERGSYTSPRPIHPQYPRVISVREAARLHSFPDWFRFHRTKWHGFRQVGNAVPPLLGRVLGRQVIAALQVEPSVPIIDRLALGDPQLLRFDLSQASQYWQGEDIVK